MNRLTWKAELLRSLKGQKRVFITGTDTGVGKTWVSCALARAWSDQAWQVGVFKPAESGDGGDAKALLKAARSVLALELVRPYAFKRPLAPAVAAAEERKPVRLAVLKQAYRRIQAQSERVLVEGAGGLLVPYAPRLDGAGLAKALGLPVFIIARAKLGTINHSLLTVEAARRRGLTVLGVVLNGPHDPQDPSLAKNAAVIRRLGRVPVLGPLPWGGRPF
jgi:dethiobiotin synthetase